MAVRRIHTWPDDVLRRKAAPVEDFGDDLQRLVDDMLETMYAAPGIGLAAPQVGVSKRLFVIDTSSDTEPGQVIVLANPVLFEAEEEIVAEEGCLSVPDYSAKIKRARQQVLAADLHRLAVAVVAAHGHPLRPLDLRGVIRDAQAPFLDFGFVLSLE